MKTFKVITPMLILFLLLMPSDSLWAQGSAKPEIITVYGLDFMKILPQIINRQGNEELQNELTELVADANSTDRFHENVSSALSGVSANITRFPWNRDWDYTTQYIGLLAEEIKAKSEITKQTGAPLIIIAHSWGTVLSYGAIVKLQNEGYDPEVDLLVTAGSPLGAYHGLNLVLESFGANKINSLRGTVAYFAKSKLGKAGISIDNSTPKVGKWVNIWSFGDMISGPLSAAINGVYDYRVDKDSDKTTLRKLFYHHSITGFSDNASHLFVRYDNSELRGLLKRVVQAVASGSWNSQLDKAFIEERPLLTLIIDSSGSMSSTDPKGIRLKGINYLLSLLTPVLWNVVVIDFDDDANIINGNNWVNWSGQDLAADVKRINSEGGTNIGNSLDTARAVIENNGQYIKEDESAVILLTDGVGEYDNEAGWFSKNGIEVHTISFIGKTNQVLLQQVAEETSGTYNKASSTAALIQKLSKLYSDLSDQSLIKRYMARIVAKQLVKVDFFVSNFETALQLRTLWEGSTIGVRIISPSGKIYPSTDDQVIKGDNFNIIMIDTPEQGKWQAELVGLDIPPSGEDFVFEVAATSDLDINLSRNKANEKGVNFALEGKGVDAISLDSSFARVTVPNGEEVQINANWNRGKLTFLPRDGAGNYEFDFRLSFSSRGSSEVVQREYSHSVVVGDDQIFHIAEITSKTGNYVYAPMGADIGAFVGLSCKLYRGRISPDNIVAQGVITKVFDRECQVTLRAVYSNIARGDVLELDLKQWMRDY